MELASTVAFSHAARALTHTARRHGVAAPGFRCPPQMVGADRTVRRRPDGAVVAVRVRGRPLVAVLADMVDGVVAANGLTSPRSDRLRAELWEAVGSMVAGDQPASGAA